MIVDLEQQDWQQVVNILGSANAPWIITNPLILRITQQINKQTDINKQSIPTKHGHTAITVGDSPSAIGDGHGIPTQSN